jgi:hypothetical protein
VLDVDFLVLDRVKALLADIKSKTNSVDLPDNFEAGFINSLPANGEAAEKELPAG